MSQPVGKKSSQSLRLILLGGCRIDLGNRIVEMRRKPQQLVKLLALQPNFRLQREQLVDILWRDQEGLAAANNLHKAVHAARRAFEPELTAGGDSKFIITKDGQIVLTAPDGLLVDALEFEKLAAAALAGDEAKLCEAALVLYAGDLLPENLYEEWTSERREYLRAICRRLLKKLVGIYESERQFERSADAARKIVAADAFDEAARRDLMRLLALGGNPRQAVRQFEICQAVLQKELGVEPERETRELFEQIVSGKFPPPENETKISEASTEAKNFANRGKTNLPHQLTSFVGRAAEIRELRSLLKQARLLTLTGAGGIGKTRLACEAAKNLLVEFQDGVYLIELASLNDSASPARAVGAALGVSEDGARPLPETLREFLRDKQILLILDNCEQIIEACAALAADLLKNCQHLRVLATSREALDAPGEIVWSVATLSLPPEVLLKTAPADFADCEAVSLFLERVRLVNPHFSLTSGNFATVAWLCRRLDGIPLAIELAAARVRSLSIEEIAARLDDSLQILTGGGRAVAPRHRTLQAAIDWSYQLLSEQERAMWRALSVFAGGFTLKAAEFICAGLPGGGDGSILETLTHLIDKSIVLFDGRESKERYSMLETIRQFAAERLRGSDAESLIRARHFSYFSQLARRSESELSSAEQRVRFASLDEEIENLRVALEWSSTADAAEFLSLTNDLWQFWQSSGKLAEGRGWFESALDIAIAAPLETRVKAFQRLGGLMVLQCDFAGAARVYEDGLRLARASGNECYAARILANFGFTLANLKEFERAETLLGEGLEIFRRINDEKGVAQILNGLGSLAFYLDDLAEASNHFAESLTIYRRLDHRLNVVGLLQNLGTTTHLQKNLSEAENYLTEALELAEKMGERRWLNQTRHVLGYVCNDQKDYARAWKFFAEALTLDSEIGGKDNVAHVFEGLACTAAAQKKYSRAIKLIAFADRLRDEIKTPRSLALQNYFDDYWNFARRHLKLPEINLIAEEIRYLSDEEMLAFSLESQ